MALPKYDLPSQEALNEMLSYDPITGDLHWKKRKITSRGMHGVNARCSGKLAGYIDALGYRKIMIGQHTYSAHRVAWKMMTGEDPSDLVDHIDGDSGNNKWVNLRSASSSQNTFNTPISAANTSGFRGVSWINAHQKWRAAIGVQNRKIHLGYFSTPERASAAYNDAVDKFGLREFMRT